MFKVRVQWDCMVSSTQQTKDLWLPMNSSALKPIGATGPWRHGGPWIEWSPSCPEPARLPELPGDMKNMWEDGSPGAA